MLTVLKDWATIAACVIAAGSLIVAVRTYVANKRNQQDTIVQRAYSDYVKMALENPAFAFPLNQKFDYEDEEFEGSNKEFERYEWFVSGMLNTVYLILAIEGKNRFWREMMENQIAYHWRYLSLFQEQKPYLKNWRTNLGAVMDEGIKKGKKDFSSVKQRSDPSG
jgi:hypothetical protein